MITVFLRALEAEDKTAALREAICDPVAAKGRLRFEVDPTSFASVPRSPFAYWASERLRRLFTELPVFQAQERMAAVGVQTSDDFRFVRLAWESERRAFVPFVKGGSYSPFYADVFLTLQWMSHGRQLKASVESRYGTASKHVQNQNFYFRPGITWPLRTTSGLSLRAMPAGCIFGHKGPAAFANDDSQELLALLAIMTSRTFASLVELQCAAADAAARSYEVGVIQRTPIPRLTTADKITLATVAHRAWSLKRSLDTRTENSHAFTLPALLQVEGVTLPDRAITWAEQVRVAEVELAQIQAEIDARCFDLYGIDETDRRIITEGFGTSGEDTTEPEAADETDSDDDDDITNAADAVSLTVGLVSWTIGVVFGRFDVRLATGERALPAEPEPFDPLPVCSPAMLTGEDGLLLATAPAGHPLTLPTDGILVDDPGHTRDLTTAVHAVFDVAFGDHADARWHEAASLLDPKDHNLHAWLTKNFFEYHIKRYSKSRRKAPILWQLATSSGQYAIWLYAYRLTRDSFFQIVNDFVDPKLQHEERKLTSLVQSAGGNPTASQRKEIAEQEAFVEELRTFREEVARIAPLWNPDLNDGVIINFAPLWRLVPQHRPWQKECKDCWDKLVDGDYDWAHLAMHLWPERVVSKCAKDRSLAIAHGLEEEFWVEDTSGKWQPRKVDQVTINNLIKERTSAAVKDALKSLLEAPSTSGTRRTQGGRRTITRGTMRQRRSVNNNQSSSLFGDESGR